MQPILILSASHPGILYLNGSFAGEINSDLPLMRPVGGRGALYLDYRPLSNACKSMARRLVFSGGAPMAESAAACDGLNIIIWSGGAIEIELTPESNADEIQSLRLGEHRFTLDGARRRLICDGAPLGKLPEGAQPPEYRALADGVVLLGACTGGRYLFACDAACTHQTGFLQAQQIEIEGDGRIRAVVSRSDLVGHATLEIWRLTANGLMLASSEPAWADGAPHWPQTPAETARAAIEAALADLDAEAEGYLSPRLREQLSAADLKSMGDLCVEMKYAPPSARPCVGMLQLEGDHLARVRPLYFRAIPSGGVQGPWQIDAFEWE